MKSQTYLGIQDESRYNVLTRLGWHRKFHPVKKYGSQGDKRLHFGVIPCTHKYDRVLFIGLLIDEHNLRMNLQERARIERNLKLNLNSLYPPLKSGDSDNEKWARDVDEAENDYSELSPLLCRSSDLLHQTVPKTQALPSHPRTTKSHDKRIKTQEYKLYGIIHNHSWLSRKLYERETMLPDLVKQIYESIRKDPKWYLRKELVNDCANRGGCCSRGCGCCALRAKDSYEKGIGHCTVECSCCVDFRGFRPSIEEKLHVLNGMSRALRCDVPTHFVRMVNAYFSKP